jgi:hypothetical protein
MKTLITQLNYAMKKHIDWGHSPVNAIDEVAHDFMLILIEDDGEQCRIYQAADGAMINCWHGPPTDDGYGFDDQTAWFMEDLITQAEAAEMTDVTISAIHQAIKDGRLHGYQNPDAPQRQGRTLVSQSEVEKAWL